jgi:serine/alanine adding enzyme
VTGIRVFQEQDRTQWNEYVLHSNVAGCYHLSGWKDVIEKSFGHRTLYLLSEDSSHRINGILPLVQLRSLLFGNYMVSLPYFNYGGVCADNEEIRDRLLAEAIGQMQLHKARHIELRHAFALNGRWREKTSKVAMKLALPSSPDDLWKSFPSKLRSQIQRPVKEGMSVKTGREECLDEFYGIFAENMRDLGTPVYAKAFFRNILRTFPEQTWICTVSTEQGRPVAAGFLVGFRDMLEIPWASSLRRYNRLSPNMLLYWSVLKVACEKGFRYFDFGRSTPHEGTFRFKEQWGAKPVQLYWHYWMRDGRPMPELNPHNPKYRMAIEAWKKMPLFLTRLIGPPIVKHLP